MSLDADGRHQQVRIKATMSADDWTERSGRLYERAILDGDTGALAVADRELDAVEADLALARGRVMHGRFLAVRNEDPERATENPQELTSFERAARLYRGLRPAALTSSRARSRKPARNCRQRCRGQRLTGRPGASQLAAPA
jgi:hypothetical protein